MTETAKPIDDGSDGFSVASFAIDGKLEGLGRWDNQNLSPKWTKICEDILRVKGDNFDYNWTGALSHVRTKCTSARGAAICTFFVNDQSASSILLVRGHDSAAERDVARLFVNSLQKVPLVQVSTNISEPFVDILSISERPLMVVVPFPIDAISDQDHGVVRELSLHLAAAYFTRRA
jgi:hypothetical protein